MNTDHKSNNHPDEGEAEALHGRIAEALAPLAVPGARASSLRSRLTSRIAQSAARHRGVSTFRSDEARWQQLTKGVRAHVLHDTGSSRSAIVQFEPGSHLPGHRHAGDEECVVLKGSLYAGDAHVGVHDYHLAPAGSRHSTIHTDEGAIAFLRGTSIGKTGDMVREVAGALLPARGAQPFTVAWREQGFRQIAAGVYLKPLWEAGETASYLMKLDPGARLSGHGHRFDEECLMLSGEAFFGDMLLRTGEYQLAPKGYTHGEAYSDVGALIYVHGDAEYLRLK